MKTEETLIKLRTNLLLKTTNVKPKDGTMVKISGPTSSTDFVIKPDGLFRIRDQFFSKERTKYSLDYYINWYMNRETQVTIINS